MLSTITVIAFIFLWYTVLFGWIVEAELGFGDLEPIGPLPALNHTRKVGLAGVTGKVVKGSEKLQLGISLKLVQHVLRPTVLA